jgi:predicted DNA-binding transcriptional regulator AlpA
MEHANIEQLQREADAIFQDRPIGIRQVELMSGYSKPTIWRRIRSGQFPAPRFREGKSTVRWSYLDVRQWVDTKLGKQQHEQQTERAVS